MISMLSSANVEAQGALVMVQRTTTGPAPVAWVKVEVGLAALLKEPVPPLCTVQAPTPGLATLPPKEPVVPNAQIE